MEIDECCLHMLMNEKNFTVCGSPESPLGDNRMGAGRYLKFGLLSSATNYSENNLFIFWKNSARCTLWYTQGLTVPCSTALHRHI